MIDLSKKLSNLNHKITLSNEARKDLLWWYCCLTGFNGTTYFPKEWKIETAEIVHTDASDIACGAVYRNKWAIIEYVGTYAFAKEKTIAYREMLAMVMSLATFGTYLKNSQVVMNVDNEAVRLSLIKGYSKDPGLMSLIRATYFYTTIYNIDYRVIRVSSVDNIAADAVSRKDWSRLFNYLPYLEKNPVTCPNVILDF